MFLSKVIKPESNNEDFNRRKFILNILLTGSLFFTAVIFVVLLHARLISYGPTFRGSSPLIAFATFVFFLVLYFLSRKGFFVAVSYILIVFFFLTSTYAVYSWGIDIPQGLLTYVLVIVMAGVLISTRFAFVATLIISFTLLLLAYLQNNFITHPDLYWKKEMLKMEDAIVIVVTFAVIAAVSWLSNREIEKSLRRARKSEADLKKERNLLEIKVEERTKELKKAQAEKMSQLYRFANFGRLAGGIIHDLTTPLSVVSINLERLRGENTFAGGNLTLKDEENKKQNRKEELVDAKSFLERAVDAAKRMSNFIQIAREQIQKQDVNTSFSLGGEIHQAIQMLDRRSKEKDVEISFDETEPVEIYGNPMKLHQLITNLLSNAIDAYNGRESKESEKQKNKILVVCRKKNNIAVLIVRDWGGGILDSHIDKIFEPFFTTKHPKKGIGIGLSISKDIVEKDFKGEIRVESKEGQGSIFTVEFPLINPVTRKQ